MGLTFKEMAEKLNNRLDSYNQETRVAVYEKCRIVLISGQVFEGKKKREFVGLVMSKNPSVWTANVDRLLSGEATREELKRAIAAKGGKACQAKHKDRIRKNLNTGSPWNKGKKNSQVAWNKGLTKETNTSIRRLSESRKGEQNPMYGKRHSTQYKAMQSARVKQAILEGRFTPNSNNRNTHWDVYFSGKKFRSSWEAVFYAINPEFEYETLRIPYYFNGKERIYIVDFCNHITKHAVEVKPKELLGSPEMQAKLSALKKWATDNDYTVEVFTQDSLIENISRVDLTQFDYKTQKKLSGFINEANKKNRNF